MTEAGKTTLDRARQFQREKFGEDWEGDANDCAEFADELTAELQKENAVLREALEEIVAAYPYQAPMLRTATKALGVKA